MLSTTPSSIVISGGGERVVAWHLGVLAGLADAGLDLARPSAIAGTSAGAFVAALISAGLDPRAAADALAEGRVSLPDPAFDPDHVRAIVERVHAAYAAPGTLAERRRRVGRIALEAATPSADDVIARVAARLPTDRWPERLAIAVIDAESGERAVLDAHSGIPLARGVAAARALPGLLPPIEIAGRRYMDGAIGSLTNADLLAAAAGPALVVAALPDAPPAPGSLEGLFVTVLDAETAALRARGTAVDVVRAGPADLAAMGDDLLSGAGAAAAARAGRRRVGAHRAELAA